VVLAGGRGTRIGGAKACVPVAGRPLLAWPLAALTGALVRVAVVAKADSELPELPHDVCRWDEPALPRHPIAGIIEALRRAGGDAVVVCAVDLPLVDGALVARLASADAGGAPAVIAAASAVAGGEPRPQPLLGRYEPGALEALCAAPADAPLTATVLALCPALLEVPAVALLNVNDERDLRVAEERLRG
jgi:molybdopterin-guanine dinucleotide biosynthesis protein A